MAEEAQPTEAERREAQALSEQAQQEQEKAEPFQVFNDMPGEADPEELRRREQESGSEIPVPGDEEGPAPSLQIGPDGTFYNLDGTVAPEGAKHGAATAFLVVIDRSGVMWATPDIKLVDRITIDRPAGNQDFIPACSQIISDVQTMKTTGSTVNAVMQTSQAMAEQQRIGKMQEKLAQKGIHLAPGQHPGRR